MEETARCYQEAVVLARQVDDSELIVVIYENLEFLYSKFGRPIEAEQARMEAETARHRLSPAGPTQTAPAEVASDLKEWEDDGTSSSSTDPEVLLEADPELVLNFAADRDLPSTEIRASASVPSLLQQLRQAGRSQHRGTKRRRRALFRDGKQSRLNWNTAPYVYRSYMSVWDNRNSLLFALLDRRIPLIRIWQPRPGL